ncbi:MAG: PAS domain-containing protein [Treponema sp.]|jgi:two-component system phosphate regulon sensor histidine kinase PhoR|nr:PAS domain-containing protein [Treponema sp.]
MRGKILRFVCATAGFSIVLTAIFSHFALYWDYSASEKQDLAVVSAYIGTGFELAGLDYLESLARTNIQDDVSTRITLVAPGGQVLFDTDAGAESMENHLSRREIQEAMQTGSGRDTRFSQTMRKQTYYYALRLQDGNILRTAKTTDSIFIALVQPVVITVLIALFIFTAAALISSRVTGRLVESINRLNLDNPEDNDTYEELSPLLSRMKKQNDMISFQLSEQRKRQLQFTAITDNMREGLIILDQNALVLSCNKSALRLLEVRLENIENQNALVIRRDRAFRTVVEKVIAGATAETLLASPEGYREGHLRIFANPVLDNRTILGAVLLILDVTEQEDRERLRREFSANVSHELKTPLMAISGYAEIMAGGLTKPEDMGHFAQNIYGESQRLIALIGDILLLSRLDERHETPPAETIDLAALAGDIVERISGAAAERGLHVYLDSEEAEITGVRHILDEMIYNLLDNAVKYNRQDGEIRVSIKKIGDEVEISVADTGIGIAPSEQERIFERFYRVDKSRSKAAGGTGLGLSIVKHGAALHHATLEVLSDGSSGSRFTLRFQNSPPFRSDN